MAGCALIGGETAEMPGFYHEGEYDIAGFAVGIVEKSRIINGKSISKGDRLIGIASSGLHSNGYSLVRKLLNPKEEKLCEHVEAFGTTLGKELLKPTRIYVKTILDLKEKFIVNGISNITGGGFIENIPRMVPEGLRVKIDRETWPVPPIFNLLQKSGGLKDSDMFNTFNMGIGMVIAVLPDIAEEVAAYLNRDEKQAYIIGEITSGETGVDICCE
jgi:phosphoribosylformylglycinamidine cyclo-ligase